MRTFFYLKKFTFLYLKPLLQSLEPWTGPMKDRGSNTKNNYCTCIKKTCILPIRGVHKQTKPIQIKPTNRSKKTEIQLNRKPNGSKIKKIDFFIGLDRISDLISKPNPIQTK